MNVGAVQDKLLEGMAATEKHNAPVPASELPGFDPNDPFRQMQPSQGQRMERKVSIYDILKHKQKMRRELEQRDAAKQQEARDAE